MAATKATQTLIQDLLQAIQDEEMTDVCLVGQDGVEVWANRFVLSARSNVLKRMFYGSFLEATSRRIPFEYDGFILKAIVEYCCRNEVPKFRLYIHRNAQSARRLVQLFNAADYLELTGLAHIVAQMSHNLTSRYPPLACAVYDESNLDTKISKDSLLMIQCRPYVTLPPDQETEGGIDCLSPSKLITIFQDKEVKSSELFLFEMLQKWLELSDYPDGCQVVQECASHLHLEDIEPQDLLTVVKESGFCTDKSITDAITTQALRASQNFVWSLSSRGRPDTERILVEGAGSANANGIYYRINGLAHGELYSKREVACGQQHVYTLSISVSDKNMTECRIFCTQLLTHKSIRTMAKNRTTHDATFQPLLQIIRIDDEALTAEAPIVSQVPAPYANGKGPSKYIELQLSDGDHYINARIRTSSIRNREITRNTLIKVLDFDKYLHEDCVAVHLKKISVVSQDPGHRFGNPSYYFDLFDEQNDEDSQEVVKETESPIEDEIGQQFMKGKIGMEKSTGLDQTLMNMYSCRFPTDQRPIHSKIPCEGWKVDSHGSSPVPRIRWIPGPNPSPTIFSEIPKEQSDTINTPEPPRKESNFIPLESGGLYAWLLA